MNGFDPLLRIAARLGIVDDSLEDHAPPHDGLRFDLALGLTRAALAHLERGDAAEGARASGDAIRLTPYWMEPYHCLAVATAQLGDSHLASELFEACVAADPYFDPAHSNAIHVAAELGDDDRALQASLRMDDWLPGVAENRFRVATLYLGRGDYDSAVRWFDRALNAPMGLASHRMLPPGVVTLPRLEHERQQLCRLIVAGVLPQEYTDVLHAYEWLIGQAPRPAEGEEWSPVFDWQLMREQLGMISPFHRRSLAFGNGDRIDGPTVNPAAAETAVQEFRKSSEPQFAVIDEFLTPAAADAIRAYLLDSTIWHNDAQHGRSYVGAYKNMGLLCPLVRQIIDEVADAYSGVVHGLPLEEIWAYRNVVGKRAIGVHADFAVVNINLWLTPTPASAADGSGGLLLYKVLAPADWGFDDYNGDVESIEAITRDCEPVRIPYRENRAVLFDSRMFHGSDVTRFGSTLEEWRVNVTMLFGNRGAV